MHPVAGSLNQDAAVRLSGGGHATARIPINEIPFVVEEADHGSFRASAVGAAIHTEAASLEDLHRETRDAVYCHFKEAEAPPLIRLDQVRQQLLTL